MSGEDQCYTTGFRYFVGLHLIFCHTLGRLLRIDVGDKIAWTGSVSSNSSIYIDKPNLFGGEAKEGGIKGTVDACFGASDQPANSYLQSVLGANIPAYRGLFGLVGRKPMVSANNPYIKQWSIVGERTKFGWHDEWADIPGSDGYNDMNPAHIIYEVLTNIQWGTLGFPTVEIDVDSFEYNAQLLKSEGLGISLLWVNNTSIEEFIQIILNHIDGMVYISPSTGLLTLKLVRSDYSSGALPTLDVSNIIEMVTFNGGTRMEIINQVSVNWVDREGNGQTTTVQDIAGINRMGGQICPQVIDFVGIATADIAAKLAARELQQLCVPRASCTLIINRKNFGLSPGDCFILNWDPIGVYDMVMRVNSIEMGELTDSKIRVIAVRDVYGLGAITLTTPSNTLWTNPISEPVEAIRKKITEITYWQFVRGIFGDSAAILAELDDYSTLVTCCCSRPSTDAINYELWTRNVGASEYVRRDTDSFPYSGTLKTALVPEITSTVELIESYIDTDLVKIGDYAFIEDELVMITAIDNIALTVTVNRGILDTIPVSHSVGAYLWVHKGLYGMDPTDRTVGESVEVKILPSTGKGRLPIEDSATTTITTVGRMMRPYPPGNVKINTLRWPVSIGSSAALDITWAHRDRLTQTVTLNKQDEGDIGPEAGVTYTLRLYGESGTLKKTVTGLTGTSYSWSTEVADSGLGRLNNSVRIELESVRGAIVSLQKWNLSVIR